MPKFFYRARRANGETIEGEIEADNRNLVVARLQSMQVFPISIAESGGSGLQKELNLQLFQRIGRREVTTFTRQLADLTRTGLPLVRALDVLAGQEKHEKWASSIKTIRNDVQGGVPLSGALEKHPGQFDQVYCSMVRAGETGGFLDQVLNRLATFQEAELESRSKIASSLAYPCIMVVVAVVVVGILMTFVVPNFTKMFEEMDRELPVMTQIMIGISHFVRNWSLVVIGALAALILLFRRWLKDESNHFAFDGFKLKIPLIRDFILKSALAKFSRTLGTLLDNGVPILTAMDVARGVLVNRVLMGEIEQFRSQVAEGERLSHLMDESPNFPDIAVNMVAVGEETGSLGSTLARVADTYENETDRVLKTIVTLIEPAVIVVMGVIVGFIVVSMILPIFDISANISS